MHLHSKLFGGGGGALKWPLKGGSRLIEVAATAGLTVFWNYTVKPVLSGHSKWTPKIGFHDRLSLNAGQNYCRMLQGEHSAILLTFIKLPFVIKAFVLSIFEWLLKTGFTVTVFFVLLSNTSKYFSFILWVSFHHLFCLKT